MWEILKKIFLTEISELLIVAVLLVLFGGIYVLAARDVTFQMAILPPPPPAITTIVADPKTQAILVAGTTTLANETVRVFAFSDPLSVDATADAKGNFFVVFSGLAPGEHSFSAVALYQGGVVTDPTPKIPVLLQDDYTLVLSSHATPGVQVTIGNADAATSNLIRTFLQNQQTAKIIPKTEVPQNRSKATRALAIQSIFLAVIVFETGMLLYERFKRKYRQHERFLSLGKGIYPPPR